MLSPRWTRFGFLLVTLLFVSCSQDGEDSDRTAANDTKPAKSITTLQDVREAAQPEVDDTQPKITPPPVRNETPMTATAVKTQKVTQYVVKKGDSLWSIASRFGVYADAHQWPLIFRANVAQIKDPDLIRPGMILQIQHDFDSQAVSEAIKHAKTRGAWSLTDTEPADQAYLLSS